MKIFSTWVIALSLTVASGLWAADVQWNRFRGKVKSVNYRLSTLTLDSAGDVITVKIDDDVTVLSGRDTVKLEDVKIDDKVTLLYAPKAPPKKDPEAPPLGGVYPPLNGGNQ